MGVLLNGILAGKRRSRSEQYRGIHMLSFEKITGIVVSFLYWDVTNLSQLWYLRYIVLRGPASMTRSINLLSKISMIARYSPVLIEYKPLALPFRGPSFSRGLSRSSSSARATSRDIRANFGSCAKSRSAPFEITTLYLLKGIS